MNPNEEYVNKTQAKELLGITWRRISEITKNGTLATIEHPDDKRTRLIAMSDIRAYQESRKHIPKARYQRKSKPQKKKATKESTHSAAS